MAGARGILLVWVAALSIQMALLTLITAALPSSALRGQLMSSQYDQIKPLQPPSRRSLEEVDGVTACSDCKSSNGQKCVGRTVSDENCDSCAKGQSFWPCNLKKECWCWDTSQPRDPGDEDGKVACSGCGRGGDTEVCVSNQNSLVPVGDEECKKCMEGQSFWPCDDEDLCWCWDTTKPKKPPAPASGLQLATEIDPNVPSPCGIFTRQMFETFAPNNTFPYTYEGLCDAIDEYNLHHTEKFAGHGTEDHIRAEIAAFLGNTAHETDDFEAAREYLACGDRKEVDGKVYCKPCTNDLYDWENNICSVSMVDQNAPYNSYCQPGFTPPEGCNCTTITQVEEEGPLAGYVEASAVFYGRGAIQLSWNYNYIRASYALTGNAETFCEDPEQVATTPEFAWGSGIYFWMENQKEGSTCHKEALKGEFGGTLNNINGGLECPAYKGGWHADAIKMRLNRYCHAASLLGMESLSSLGGCSGMRDSFEECLLDGHCRYCEQYSDGVAESEPEPEEDATQVPVEEEPTATETQTASSQPTGVPATPGPTLVNSVPSNTEQEASTSSLPASVSPTLETVEEANSPSPTTVKQTSQPTLTPTTGKPSASPLNSPTEEPTTAMPTFSPTTPQPTMGPCDGEKCPGEMCRSTYGFCGGGEAYCNDSAIWSPKCREDSDPPSPQPTQIVTDEPSNSPAEQATPALDEVFAVSETDEPTKEPSVPAKGSFTKPTGGKKPGGGKPKPSASSTSSSGSKPSPATADADEPSPENTSSTPPPTPLPTPQQPIEPVTESPTPKPAAKVYSPTDPESTYFCGKDWGDANDSCAVRCPSSKSDECPTDHKCFAFTSCMEDKPEDADDNTSDQPTHSPFTNPPATNNPPATPAPITPSPTDEATKPEGCAGAPCPFAGECRSQYGFCGTSFIYCNNLSSWTFDTCGLFGVDSNGEPVLCEADVRRCPEGKHVYRDPSNDCEHFPCPSDEEEENAETSFAFQVPSPSNSRFPELPKPTLPTISKPTPYTLPSVSRPSSSTVDLGKKPSGSADSTVAIVGEGGEVEDDGGESPKTAGQKEDSQDPYELQFGNFNAQDWFASGAYAIAWSPTLAMLATVMIAMQ